MSVPPDQLEELNSAKPYTPSLSPTPNPVKSENEVQIVASETPTPEETVTPETVSSKPPPPEVSKQDNSILFMADAQAILENAPDLETGYELLTKSYNSDEWNNRESVKSIFTNYAQQLRYRFNDKEKFDIEQMHELAIVPYSKQKNEETPDAISRWEKENLEALNQRQDPDSLILKTKLEDGFKEAASYYRRQALSKDESWIADKFYRGVEGLATGPLKLFGLNDAQQYLTERTDPDEDDSFIGTLASGAGQVAGIVGTTLGTGGIGGAIYLGAGALGEARDTYETSLKESGDSTRAAIAGGVELANQGIQAGVAGKIFGKLGGTLRKSIFGGIEKEAAKEASKSFGKEVLKSAAFEGGTEGAGQVVSNIARNYGTNDWRTSVWENVLTSTGAAAILGGSVEGIRYGAIKLANKNVEAFPLVEPVKEVKESNTIYTPTNENTAQQSPITEDPNELIDTMAEGENRYVPRKQIWEQQYWSNTKRVHELYDILDSGKLDENQRSQVQDELDRVNTILDDLNLKLEASKSEGVSPIVEPSQEDLNIERQKAPVNFVTEDGKEHYSDNNINTKVYDLRGNITEEQYDGTVYVSKETAQNLNNLLQEEAIDGTEPLMYYSDEDGTLKVKSQFVTPKGKLQDSFTGTTNVTIETVPMGVGAVPIRVNSNKILNGNSSVYTVPDIGKPIKEIRRTGVTEDTGPEEVSIGSVGAAYAGKESAFARRIRTSDKNAQPLKDQFGTEDWGYIRYQPKPDALMKNSANNYISENGVAHTTNYLLNKDILQYTPEDAGLAVTMHNVLNEMGDAALREGDEKTAARLFDNAQKISVRMAIRGPELGQIINTFKFLDNTSPSGYINSLNNDLTESAYHAMAKEEGVTVASLLNVDSEIETVDTEIENLKTESERNANIIAESYDPEIKSAQEELSSITNIGKEAYETYKETQQQKISNIETTIKKYEIEDIEAQTKADEKINTVKTELKTKQTYLKGLQTKIQNAETRLKNLQAQAKDERLARKNREARLAAAEKIAQEKGGKAGESIRKNAKKLSDSPLEPDEGLSVEEKKELHELLKTHPKHKKEAANAIKDIARIEEVLSKNPESKNARKHDSKLAELNKLLSKEKADLKTATPDSFLNKKEKGKRDRARQDLNEARSKKAEVQRSKKLTPEKEATLNNLKTKRDKLSKRKEKIQKRVSKETERLKKREPEIRRILQTAKRLGSTSLESKQILYEKVATIEREIFPEHGENKGSIWDAIFTHNVLAGTGTQGTNFKGNAFLLGSQSLALTAGDLARAATGKEALRNTGGNFLQGIWSAFTSGKIGVAAKTTFQGKDIYRPGDRYGITSPDLVKVDTKLGKRKHRDFLKDPPPEWIREQGKLIQGAWKLYSNIGYAMRFMSAVDAGFYTAAKEGQIRARLYTEAIDNKAPDIKKYIAEKLGNSTVLMEEALKTAREDAQVLREVGIHQNETEILQRAFEIAEHTRPENIRKSGDYVGLKLTLQGKPAGVIGFAVGHLNEFAKEGNIHVPWKGKVYEIPSTQFVLKFLNVAGNIANEMLNYTPMGFARAALDPETLILKKNLQKQIQLEATLKGLGREVPQDLASKIEKMTKELDEKEDYMKLNSREYLGKALLGSMLTGILASWFLSQDPDKDNYFDINGKGPIDPKENKAWRDAGNKPWSFKVGDKVYKYSDVGIGPMLGFLGLIRDKQKYDKSFGIKGVGDTLNTMAAAFMGAYTNQSFLNNLRNLTEEIFASTQYGSTPQYIDTPIGIIKGFVPFVGSLKDIAAIVDNRIDTNQNMWSKLIAGIPIVQRLGTRPALNVLGQPIETTLGDRFRFIGAFYNERVTNPNLRWATANGYNIKMPDTKLVIKDDYVNEKRVQKLGRIADGKLTHEEQYEFITAQGPLVANILSKYRSRYKNSGHSDKVQDAIDKEISEMRSSVKRRLFASGMNY